MSDLLDHLRSNKHKYNLADISRSAGYSSGYLKHVLAGRRCFNTSAQKKVKRVLDTLVADYSKVEVSRG